ncbi:MAG: PaaI family thioesterase [Candidatus Dormibacteria bacterium]
MSGSELFAAFGHSVPLPPLCHLTGIDMAGMHDGACVFRMIVTDWLRNSFGAVPGGVLAMPADAAMGWALVVALPPGSFYTTVEMKMEFLRPVLPGPGEVMCHGRLENLGRNLGLSTVRVVDGQGRLVAHGSSLGALRTSSERGYGAEDPGAGPVLPGPGFTPPFRRPSLGAIPEPTTLSGWGGAALVRGFVEGSLPAPPLGHLTGMRLVDLGSEEVVAAMPTSPWLRPPTPFVQGGALVALADLAMAAAVQATLPAGARATPADLKYNFVRPVLADGRDVVARARVAHAGRSISVATCELWSADRKKVGVSMSTVMSRSVGPVEGEK